MSKRKAFLSDLLGKPDAALAIDARLLELQQALDAAGVASKAMKPPKADKEDQPTEDAPAEDAPAEDMPADDASEGEPQQETSTEPAPPTAKGASEITDYMMSLLMSSEPDDVKRGLIQTVITDIMAAVSEQQTPEGDDMEDETMSKPEDEQKAADVPAEVVDAAAPSEPDADDAEESVDGEGDEQKSARAKAFDMLSEIINDQGALAEEQQQLANMVKAHDATVKAHDELLTALKAHTDIIAKLDERLKSIEAFLSKRSRASTSSETFATDEVANGIKAQDVVIDKFWGIQRPADKVNNSR